MLTYQNNNNNKKTKQKKRLKQKNGTQPKKMDEEPINLIGCDTIVNSASLLYC